jgi:hypothetical protein
MLAIGANNHVVAFCRWFNDLVLGVSLNTAHEMKSIRNWVHAILSLWRLASFHYYVSVEDWNWAAEVDPRLVKTGTDKTTLLQVFPK